MFEHPLDDAAAIRMDRQHLDLSRKAVDDERYMLWRDTLDGFLYYVIPVLVFDA